MIDGQAFRSVLGKFATGITVMTTVDGLDNPVGMTVNSFSSLSLDPPLILWSIGKSSNSFIEFTNAEYFGVHILADNQEYLSRQFSAQTGDRFAGVDFSIGDNKTPLINGCVARMECKAFAQHDGGDHIILIGQVLAMESTEESPLVFFSGQYRHLSKP